MPQLSAPQKDTAVSAHSPAAGQNPHPPTSPEHRCAVELDELDRALIKALQQDPLFSPANLADQWNVTNVTIRNRTKRLKSSGVIDVAAVINPYKAGLDVFAQIGIRVLPGADLDHFVETLQAVEGITSIMRVAGRFDFFITYVCNNMAAYHQFVSTYLHTMPQIASFESFIGLELYRQKALLGRID